MAQPPGALMLRVLPAEQAVEVGGSIRFTCFSQSTPKWLKDDFPIPAQYQQGSVLQIGPATEQDTGQYLCNGTLPTGQPFLQRANAYVGCKPKEVRKTVFVLLYP